jgi:type IV secretory pathway VirJ component
MLTNEPGLSADERQRAVSMTTAGAMVASVPIGPFYRRLAAQSGKCAYAAGAFENLAHHVQAFDKLPTYLEPIMVGAGANAAFAYALFAQAPASTFGGVLSIDFCPRLDLKLPLCAANALRWNAAADGTTVELEPANDVPAPWTALQTSTATGCPIATARAFVERVAQGHWVPVGATGTSSSLPVAFDSAFDRLATRRLALSPAPSTLEDLPVVEVPSLNPSGKQFAVLLSGDGGWAGIDKSIAAALAKAGTSVVGFDSLRYFWTARTPDGLASDLDRVIRLYAARWNRNDVILIGYSQGADVLPFAVNRLPAQTQSRVRLTALLGPGQKAAFEFHVANWIGPSGDRPIAPEAEKLSASTTLCVYGADERDSLCPQLAPLHARVLQLPGGHHFGGDYDALAGQLLEFGSRKRTQSLPL